MSVLFAYLDLVGGPASEKADIPDQHNLQRAIQATLRVGRDLYLGTSIQDAVLTLECYLDWLPPEVPNVQKTSALLRLVARIHTPGVPRGPGNGFETPPRLPIPPIIANDPATSSCLSLRCVSSASSPAGC